MAQLSSSAAGEAARALFARDRASQQLGMDLFAIEAGSASVRMTVRADMTNGHGTCHGGYIFALADSAFAFACNSHGPATVASAVAIDFLVPARIGDVSVTRADGTVIAHARGRSHRLQNPSPPTAT
jgi:acyl-CoA thioesterase